MEKEFDFENIGKKVPYRAPEGFFEDVQKNVLARTQQPHRRRQFLLRLSPVIIATAAVFSAIAFLPRNYQEVTIEQISQAVADNSDWIEEMSDEELEAMDDFSNNDIFMN